jgi:hypothetical protein
VRIELDSGETEVLITSLLDQTRYPYAVFKDLYHQRWPVEEVAYAAAPPSAPMKAPLRGRGDAVTRGQGDKGTRSASAGQQAK